MQMRLLIMRCNDSCQHRKDTVKQTYILQHRCIHHRCQTIRIEQNQIESRPQSSHPSIGVCVNRNQCQIRIEFDPATPASNTSIVIMVLTASHVQFVIPIGIPKMSGAGSSVCTTTRSCRCRCRCRTYNHHMLPVSQ